MTSYVVAIRWNAVFVPLTLPKDSLSVMLDLSCIGDEINITDCIDSEPTFLNNGQCEFIEVKCPGMTTFVFHVIWLTVSFVQSL